MPLPLPLPLPCCLHTTIAPLPCPMYGIASVGIRSEPVLQPKHPQDRELCACLMVWVGVWWFEWVFDAYSLSTAFQVSCMKLEVKGLFWSQKGLVHTYFYFQSSQGLGLDGLKGREKKCWEGVTQTPLAKQCISWLCCFMSLVSFLIWGGGMEVSVPSHDSPLHACVCSTVKTLVYDKILNKNTPPPKKKKKKEAKVVFWDGQNISKGFIQ